jgi:hypothetical protein
MKKTILIVAVLCATFAAHAQDKKPVKKQTTPAPAQAPVQNQIEKQLPVTLTYAEAITVRNAIQRADSLLANSSLPFKLTNEVVVGNLNAIQIILNSYNRSVAADTAATKHKP